MNITRRHFLATAAWVALSPTGCLCPRAVPRRRTLVNDVHSRLNPTYVRQVNPMRSLADVTGALSEARRAGVPVCIAAERHAMGAQQFATDALLMDTRELDGVLEFDPARGTVEVEAGIGWPKLVEDLLRRQGDREGVWTIAQKQTGANHLSIGGALAANIHGRGLRMRPFISDVEAFTLVDAEGRAVRCSREENADLFRLAAGGYGLFGFVYSVKLRLVRRQKLRRTVLLLDIDQLMSAFDRRIADGYLYGDFQYAVDPASDDFLRKGVFSCYQPVSGDTVEPQHLKLRQDDWSELVYLAHAAPSRAYQAYAAYYLKTSCQVYWSDWHQFTNYLGDYHAALDQRLGRTQPATEIITEIYVPRAALVSFMAEAADDFRRHGVRVIYGTVRLIERDDDSFLAWAREPYACVIFNLCTTHTAEGVEHSAEAFRRLIDMAVRRGGSYYLTYHKFATRAQIEACHPRFAEFLREKRRHDPEERFQSDWYRHHRTMFGMG